MIEMVILESHEERKRVGAWEEIMKTANRR